jgi:hypothetical protein
LSEITALGISAAPFVPIKARIIEVDFWVGRTPVNNAMAATFGVRKSHCVAAVDGEEFTEAQQACYVGQTLNGGYVGSSEEPLCGRCRQLVAAWQPRIWQRLLVLV